MFWQQASARGRQGRRERERRRDPRDLPLASRYAGFCVIAHATAPRHIPSAHPPARLHVLTTCTGMAGTRLALAVARVKRSRGDTRDRGPLFPRAGNNSVVPEGEGWLGGRGWYRGGGRAGGTVRRGHWAVLQLEAGADAAGVGSESVLNSRPVVALSSCRAPGQRKTKRPC